MKAQVDAIWNSIYEKATEIASQAKAAKQSITIVLYKDSEMMFRENFSYYHKMITEKYMKSNEELDRHKIAAIIICAILSSDILGISQSELSKCKNNKNFLANEKLALNMALSYMRSELDYLVRNGKADKSQQIDSYFFPQPLSCDRKFDEVWCRDLYFAKRDFALNPLDIAKDLFVIEEYSKDMAKCKKTEAQLKQLQNASASCQ